MIRAIRPNAAAQDDASLISGWNLAPNIAYTLTLVPGAVSCAVLLYDADGDTLIASGAALAGTEQPCVLRPQTGQTVSMVDDALGWHLLLTTTGTESQRTVRIGPMVDLPDEIHPVYGGDDDMALARATAAIDEAAHYRDDVTVACPLGLGAGIGGIVSVPVGDEAVVGQVESITWTATPDGTTDQAVIRRHVAIAPEAFVEPPTPPTLAADTASTDAATEAYGNVLSNDDALLTVVAVNGLSSNVGSAVAGSAGGLFTIAADGSWSFTPNGDFDDLHDDMTSTTSALYHATDGASEASATITVTVTAVKMSPVAVDDAGATTADANTSGNVLTNDTDANSDSLTVSQVAGSTSNVGAAVAGSSGGLFTINSDGSWIFTPNGDFGALSGEDTATTSVTYHVSDGTDEDEGTLTVTVSEAVAGDPFWSDVVLLLQPPDDAVDGSTDITDRSPSARSVALTGNAQVDTSLGYPTIQLDGNGDSVYVADDSAFDLTSDSTIEVLLNIPSGANDPQYILSKVKYGVSSGWGINLSSSDFAFYYYSGGSFKRVKADSALVADSDMHLAMCRHNDVIRCYVNGVYIGSHDAATYPVSTNSTRVTLGYRYNDSDVTRYGEGNFRLRITGAARYTTESYFTPPTSFQVG